ncbi:MAG: squalene/phytoene synthase family protein [Bacteroidetes bacterium]|nr:squalene/phytoene synthase family protein [Bacteroidota bacterium]
MNTLTESYIEIFNSISFEKIKDHPNILIAARFWDDERYDSAKTCYKFMRAIDDLIDNHKANNTVIAENEKDQFIANVDDWITSIISATNNSPIQKELIDTLDKFQIPLWPMEAFAKSMIYDIHHDGFPTVQAFLDYSAGASVAPASIFVHLCGIHKKENGQFIEPRFDVKETATPCAIFSYLVHIIRDFQKDQFNNLNYFADDLIEKNGLSRQKLRDIAYGATIPQGFRNMIYEYYILADEYRKKTWQVIDAISPLLEPRYRLSLEIIFNLYLMVFERIDVKKGSFTTEELNPTPDEIKERVHSTIVNFELA